MATQRQWKRLWRRIVNTEINPATGLSFNDRSGLVELRDRVLTLPKTLRANTEGSTGARKE